MVRLIPSIASANPLCYGQELAKLGDYPLLHLDVEDGVFVPNITFGLKAIRAIAATTQAKLDAHLIVVRPLDWLRPLAECGVQEISAHIEALEYPLEFLEQAQSLGMRAGLALNLKTPLQTLESFYDSLDFVLAMAAEPDGGDYRFRPAALRRLQQLRSQLPSRVSLWVDGGVGAQQLPQVVAAGADTVILGRAVWQSPQPLAQLELLQKSIE